MASEKRERERKDEPEKKPVKKLDGDFLLNWTKSMIKLIEDNQPELEEILRKQEEKRAKTADKEETQDDGHNSDFPPPSPTTPRTFF